MTAVFHQYRHCLTAIATGLFLSLSGPAFADPAQVAPDGWARAENGSMIFYRSPNGREVTMFRYVDDVSDSALAVKMIADGLASAGDKILSQDAFADGPVSVNEVVFKQRNIDMMVRVFGVRQADGEFLALAHMAPATEAGFAERLEESARKMAALADTTAPAAAPKQSPPPVKQNNANISRILFRRSYAGGAGGFTYPVHDPVVLFKDGTVSKTGGHAVDEIDVASLKRESPSSVGRWKKHGAEFSVTWSDGKTTTLDPNVGPPKALPNAAALTGEYQAIGGGGSVAFGGGGSVAFGGGTVTSQVKGLVFHSNGRFSQSDKRTASSQGGVGKSTRGANGAWSLSGSTLTLSYDSGTTVRTSVFYSASRKKSASFGPYGVLWIGGEDYKRIR